MCRITYFHQTQKMQIEKSRLGNLIFKYDVIHDALKLISDKNLKRPRNLGDMGTGRNFS
jgi:hypothetical protein